MSTLTLTRLPLKMLCAVVLTVSLIRGVLYVSASRWLLSISRSKIRSEGIAKSPFWPGFGNPGRAKLDLLSLARLSGPVVGIFLAKVRSSF